MRGMPNLSSSRQHPVLVALGRAIRRIRKDRGLSQEQLALTAGIDVSYLGRVERGDNNASVLALHYIAEALGMTMTALMTEANL
jgi:transcriptional regulator with XRE-family HTH domain